MNEALREMKQLDQWVAHNAKKIPFGAGGVAASTTNPSTWLAYEEALMLCDSRPDLVGVGFVMSSDDPYVGVDLDNAIDDAGQVKPWAWDIVRELDSYTEVSPSRKGLHVWVRGDLPKRGGSRVAVEDGLLEVYESARYFTVTGERVDRTPDDVRDFGPLRDWYEKNFPVSVSPVATASASKSWDRPTVEEIQDALDHIGADSYQVWTDVGMALKAELGASGFALWRDWSATSPKYDGDAKCARKWESFARDGITIRTLFKHAIDNGYESRGRRRDDWLDSLASGDEAGTGTSDDDASDAPWAVDALELEAREDRREYLIGPHIAGEGDMVVIAGPPKSMKSFIVLDMLAHFSAGMPWHDLQPQRALTSLVLNMELHTDAIGDRLRILQQKAAAGRVFISPRLRSQLDAAAGINIKAHVDRYGVPDVLVVDPIANAFTGDNENDNAQMGSFLGDMERLRDRLCPGAVLVLVHHSRKASAKDIEAEPFNALRGASAIRGRYDTGIVVNRKKGGEIVLSYELRNGEAPEARCIDYDNGRFVPYDATDDAASKSDLDMLQSAMDGLPPMLKSDCAKAAMTLEENVRGKTKSHRQWMRVVNLAIEQGLIRVVNRKCELTDI